MFFLIYNKSLNLITHIIYYIFRSSTGKNRRNILEEIILGLISGVELDGVQTQGLSNSAVVLFHKS